MNATDDQLEEDAESDDDGDGKEGRLVDDLPDLAVLVVQAEMGIESNNETKQEADCFVSSTSDRDNIKAFVASARDVTVCYALSGTLNNDLRYHDSFYYGGMVDTRCATASSGGFLQYIAYCCYFDQLENTDTPKTAFCTFGIGG